MYDHVRKVNCKNKDVIQQNRNRESLPEIAQEVYVKTVQKQSKIKTK